MSRPDGPDAGIDMDLSELRGRTYRCVDGCALCCLCQPELLPDEETKFRKTTALAEGVAERHISPEVKGAAIKLRGAHGACHFLKDRRCRIYQDRPHFCRSFPLNVFVGWRIQVNANLSCRGIGLNGEGLEDFGRRLLSEYGEDRLRSELREARAVYAQFIKNCRDAWVAQSFSSVRAVGEALSDELLDTVGLSRLLTYAEQARTAQNASPKSVVRQVRRTEPETDVSERALIDGTELFDLPDLSLLPIYIDERFTWKLFKLVGKEIVGYVLAEDGATEEFSRTSPSEVDLLPMDSRARASMKEYLGLVNSRDCFMGHAAYLCDSEGYAYNLAQVYLGALAKNSIDLWWRSSFLAAIDGKDCLGEKEIKEGIVFFDMDLLDLPTIGAFI
ncbi:MAG: YkgJ family cysteine cluster protein [Thermoplasmata archaeon]